MKMSLLLCAWISLLLLMSCVGSEGPKKSLKNDLKNTNWIINSGSLITEEEEKLYHLSPKVDTAVLSNYRAISFIDEEYFKCYDTWECGNDCFTEIYGRYYYTDTSQIKLELDSILKFGTCEAPKEVFQHEKTILFDLVRKGDQVELIRKEPL